MVNYRFFERMKDANAALKLLEVVVWLVDVLVEHVEVEVGHVEVEVDLGQLYVQWWLFFVQIPDNNVYLAFTDCQEHVVILWYSVNIHSLLPVMRWHHKWTTFTLHGGHFR